MKTENIHATWEFRNENPHDHFIILFTVHPNQQVQLKARGYHIKPDEKACVGNENTNACRLTLVAFDSSDKPIHNLYFLGNYHSWTDDFLDFAETITLKFQTTISGCYGPDLQLLQPFHTCPSNPIKIEWTIKSK